MRQRGIISPDAAIAGLGIAIIIALVIGAFWYVAKERKAGFAAGEVSERLKWQERESTELAAVQADLLQAQKRADELERQAAADLVALDQEHLEEVTRVKADHDRFMDDLASGRVRYRADLTSCQDPHRAAQSGTSTAAGVGDGEARGELPPALARVVARGDDLAGEADAVVHQLHEAQGVIAVYLRTCNRERA